MTMLALSLGSNLGNRKSYLQRAIDSLEMNCKARFVRSLVYETEPWGNHDQPPFLNVVIATDIDIDIEKVISMVSSIEKKIDPRQKGGWLPRRIDIDILLYGDMIYDANGWKIPHPLMCDRNFVIIPLAGILPDMIHPVRQLAMKELAAGSDDQRSIRATRYQLK